ncbi:phosphoribosyltransferase [Actinophytocola sp.]|uniref:phosphoribosyltransferase n=1 Tax=Actinophytocola sp. TaxID=1872138 RepID=UPI002D7E53BF|nr:phosphoribosyltransferase [Actinophytocola sp.]HET9138068.1 phosphoribosyltransferase [Actinophytocola sp.]
MHFRDRSEAGRMLAGRLTHLAGADPVVVALPRGGLPVAVEIAAELAAPLDVIVVRKVGVPYRPELAAGAVGEDGVTVRNAPVLHESGLSWEDLHDVVERERAEVSRRAGTLRPDRPRTDLADRTVIIVDDGVATGSTVVAAVRVARQLGARRIVLAVPVAPADVAAKLAGIVDEVICLQTPVPFQAVGQWFRNFRQLTDDEARDFLRSHDAHA